MTGTLQQKRSEKNLLKAVDFLLIEAASGVRKVTANELKMCHEILNSSRPPIFYIQHVLVNQYAFLQEWHATTAERQAVADFLQAFQRQAADDLQGRAGTLKDGIELAQEGDLK